MHNNESALALRELANRTSAQTASKLNGASSVGEDEPEPLRIVDPITLQDKPIPERQWVVPDWIPRGVVTGLYGPGGLGKTLLVQQLLTATALGRQWLGLVVAPGRAFGVFCEDPEDELHRRQADINRLYGCEFADLDRMRWSARIGHDNLLMTFDLARPRLTRFFDQLLAEAHGFRAELVVIDTVSDVFGGNENDRSQVRQFIQYCLGKIAREISGTVVACAHPSRSGQSSGEGDGASTGWNAGFRSRLYLSSPKSVDGSPVDANARVLERKKANYAQREDSIDLRWKDGVFTTERQASGIIAAIEKRTCERVFLDLLDKTAAERQWVSSNSRSGNYARSFSLRDHGERQRASSELILSSLCKPFLRLER
jgi:RecA-family ATPase